MKAILIVVGLAAAGCANRGLLELQRLDAFVALQRLDPPLPAECNAAVRQAWRVDTDAAWNTMHMICGDITTTIGGK